MDEHGRWLPKARKVYDLDENGERIRLPSGNWKCHKENTVDWTAFLIEGARTPCAGLTQTRCPSFSLPTPPQ